MTNFIKFIKRTDGKIPTIVKPKIIRWIGVIFLGGLLLGLIVYQIPSVHNALSWRLDYALIYVRSIINPVPQVPKPAAEALPEPLLSVVTITPTPGEATITQTPAPALTLTPTLSPTAISGKALLSPPGFELEGLNNCGPATLAMNLRYYGWEGDQYSITKEIKPDPADKNVNVEELVYYTRTFAGWLNIEYRVGGSLDDLKRYLAAGMPVIIEQSFMTDRQYWVGDDRWAGHYLLLTGYDDSTRKFIVQDSQLGADRPVDYDKLYADWQSFNRVYLIVYRPEDESTIKNIMGDNWDKDKNRQNALLQAQADTEKDPTNAFAWFNFGTNLDYFDRYGEAANAYDHARNIGLPQRMFRYQFGPFIAYFNTNRNQDLLTLTDFALTISPNSEENLMWRGWALYRSGDKAGASDAFQKALKAHPGYSDAQYGLDFVTSH